MSNSSRILATSIALLLCLSAYQTYQNAADCKFYGFGYSWFRGACIGVVKPLKRKGAVDDPDQVPSDSDAHERARSVAPPQ